MYQLLSICFSPHFNSVSTIFWPPVKQNNRWRKLWVFYCLVLHPLLDCLVNGHMPFKFLFCFISSFSPSSRLSATLVVYSALSFFSNYIILKHLCSNPASVHPFYITECGFLHFYSISSCYLLFYILAKHFSILTIDFLPLLHFSPFLNSFLLSFSFQYSFLVIQTPFPVAKIWQVNITTLCALFDRFLFERTLCLFTKCLNITSCWTNTSKFSKFSHSQEDWFLTSFNTKVKQINNCKLNWGL